MLGGKRTGVSSMNADIRELKAEVAHLNEMVQDKMAVLLKGRCARPKCKELKARLDQLQGYALSPPLPSPPLPSMCTHVGFLF